MDASRGFWKEGLGGLHALGRFTNARSSYIPGGQELSGRIQGRDRRGRLLEEGRGKGGRAGRMGRERRASQEAGWVWPKTLP